MDGDIDAIKQLLVKLAVIAEQVDARSRGALQRIEAGATTLDRSAQRWTGGADDFSRRVLDTIGAHARDSLASATRQAVSELDAQLRRSAGTAKWAADALAEQRKLLTRTQRSLLRVALLALLVGSMLAAGGSAYLAWHNLRAAALGADVGEAIRAGTLVHCPGGEGVCVRIGSHPRRSGSRGEYLVVQPQDRSD